MRVAVVVVTYNSANVIAGLVESLERGLAGVDWELVVADNASTDGVVEVVRSLAPYATVIEMGRNGGYAAGINGAVAAAEPFDAVLVLNPDVRLGDDCAATLTDTLRMPGTGIAVPKLVDAQGALIESQRREPSIPRAFADAILGARRAGRIGALGEIISDPAAYEAGCVVDWAEGSTMLISASCLGDVGPWDESYFLYSEETDFALRARDMGFAARFDPKAIAQHLEGGSAVTPELWTLVVLNRVRLYTRRHGLAASVAFWFAVLIREASRAMIGKPTARMAVRALVSPRRLRERPGPHSIRRS